MSSDPTNTNEKGAKRRGRPPTLNRAQILDAALRLVSRDGREALSMRALATALGTGAMSLYSHVRDKEGLLEDVAALALDRVNLSLDKRGTWRDRLLRWMNSLRRQMLAHPAVWQLLAKHQWGFPWHLRAGQAAAEILVGAGFGTRAAAEAAQGLIWAVIGFVWQESACRQIPRAESERQQAAALAALSDEERSKTEPLLSHFATRNFDRLYDSTIRRLLAGLEAELEKKHRSAPRRRP